MKKIYSLLAMSTLVASSIFGQQQKNAISTLRTEAYKANPNTLSQKALGSSFWTDDFSTAANWTISNAGQTAADFGWGIGSTSNSWYLPSITSTSGGDYASVNNGDPTQNPGTQVVGVEYTITTATSIDVTTLSGGNSALLEFEQFGARFNDAQSVQVSVDGNNFTTVYDNSSIEALSAAGGSAYSNPMHVSVNISSAIASNPSTVWIRFSWTSAFPTDTDPNVWLTYGWFIDDVALVSLTDNDISVSESLWGTNSLVGLEKYTKVPTSQMAPVTFANFVTNEGQNEAKNVVLTVDLNNGLYTGTSAANVNLAPGTVDSLIEVETPFTPTVDGTYSFTWTLENDSVDDVPANNELTGGSYEVGGLIYQKDKGTLTSSVGMTDAYKVGNFFQAITAEDVYSIDFVVGAGSDATATVFVNLYEVTVNAAGNALVYTEVANSSEYDLTSSDVSSNALLSLKFLTPYTLNAGSLYAAMVGTYGGTGTEFKVGTSGTESGVAFRDSDQKWFSAGFGPTTPMVRLNFENVLTTTASVNQAANNCINDNLTFTSQTQGGQAPYTYEWNFGDGNTATTSNATHAYTGSSNYTVVYTVTDNNAVTASETFTVQVGNCYSSIKENKEVEFVNNYPNPFSSITKVNFSLASTNNVSIEVTDLTGKIMNVVNLGNLNSGNHSIELDANELSSGVYYYSIITNNSRVTSKMIVQK